MLHFQLLSFEWSHSESPVCRSIGVFTISIITRLQSCILVCDLSFGRNICVQQYRIGHGGAEAAHAISEAAAKNLTPLTLVVSIMLHVNLLNNY